MNALLLVCIMLSVLLLTYLLHSTLMLLAVKAVVRRSTWNTNPELRVQAWKLALVLPILTAVAVTVFNVPHFGIQFPIWNFQNSSADNPLNESTAVHSHINVMPPVDQESDAVLATTDIAIGPLADDQTTDTAVVVSSTSVAGPSIGFSWLWLVMPSIWLIVTTAGFGTLAIQWHRLRQFRLHAEPIEDMPLTHVVARIAKLLGVRRHVAVLTSDDVEGPVTAGILAPFILMPSDLSNHENSLATAERDAMLAHELVHIARADALWNLVMQIICRTFPFQPLNWIACQQIREDMDFVADSLAAGALGDRTGLAQCLIRLGHQIAENQSRDSATCVLSAGMASFRSTLGRRIETLLADENDLRRSSVFGRSAVVAVTLSAAILIVALLPRANAQNPALTSTPNPVSLPGNPSMNKSLSTLAVLVGLAMPVGADEPKANSNRTVPAVSANADTVELSTTPDPLPKGMTRFNGMLVGRLAARDVEKGTFIVQIDAVPRVWKNSAAENPKSIVGKTVEVTGVFGKFLDVLVVTRTGETIEFECRHDGDRLVFPGELLRKVAPYDPADYPVLPEEFRGFQGTVSAEIVKKDPETFELIIQVEHVKNVGQENAAKDPKSIEGKPLMLAGFWNKKDAYHKLKQGDRFDVSMKHIGLRSDHLTVAEISRNSAEKPDDEAMMKKDDHRVVSDGMTREVRGFRGMLVGRLVEKDIERGTFTITVDAVPRVWNNNKATNPKTLLGSNVSAEGVTGKMLDVLVVARKGETVEFGALHDGGDRMRVGEVLRKVAPVRPEDYPVLPDDFRGFKGFVEAKVMSKDDHLFGMIVEITAIRNALPASQAKEANSIIGKQATLAGFWNRKDAFHDLNVGDTIECGVEHPQRLTDHLSVIESVRKIESK